MTIEFDCPHCREHLSMWDELGGKRGRCPKCEEEIIVPRGVRSDVFVSCPRCGADIAATAKICTECGTDLKSGVKLETRVNEPSVLQKVAQETAGSLMAMLWRAKFVIGGVALFIALILLLFSIFGNKSLDPAQKVLEDGKPAVEGR